MRLSALEKQLCRIHGVTQYCNLKHSVHRQKIIQHRLTTKKLSALNALSRTNDLVQCAVINCQNKGCRYFSIGRNMAKSKFEYVKQFEIEDRCIPNCWIVVRIDGKSFHRFTDVHHFVKPNDDRGLNLMTRAAQCIMEEFNDIVLAYGQSDEYSFVFKKNTTVYNRRGSKIMTNLVSQFSAAIVFYWSRYFNTQSIQYPPSFDARIVLYPSDQNLRDYLSWRQADCHVNNLYNTCFWKLVQEKGLTKEQSQLRLKGTLASDKNEILFSEFDINYNNLPELHRKGTVLIRHQDKTTHNGSISTSSDPSKRSVSFSSDLEDSEDSSSSASSSVTFSSSRPSVKLNQKIDVLHCDIIGEKFWREHPEILTCKK